MRAMPPPIPRTVSSGICRIDASKWKAFRASVLGVSGQLNPNRFGPAMKPRIPDAALEANSDKQSIWQPSDEREASRRTIYAFVKRGLVVPMLEVLDLADTVGSCPQRQVTTVAPQA